MNENQNKLATIVVSITLIILSIVSPFNTTIFLICKYAVYSLAILNLFGYYLEKTLIPYNKEMLTFMVNYYGGEYKKLSAKVILFVLAHVPMLIVSTLMHDYFLTVAALVSISAILVGDRDGEDLINNNSHLYESKEFKL